MNSGAMNIGVQVMCGPMFSFFLLIYLPRSRVAGCGRQQSGSLPREKKRALTEEWVNFVLEEDISDLHEGAVKPGCQDFR